MQWTEKDENLVSNKEELSLIKPSVEKQANIPQKCFTLPRKETQEASKADFSKNITKLESPIFDFDLLDFEDPRKTLGPKSGYCLPLPKIAKISQKLTDHLMHMMIYKDPFKTDVLLVKLTDFCPLKFLGTDSALKLSRNGFEIIRFGKFVPRKFTSKISLESLLGFKKLDFELNASQVSKSKENKDKKREELLMDVSQEVEATFDFSEESNHTIEMCEIFHYENGNKSENNPPKDDIIEILNENEPKTTTEIKYPPKKPKIDSESSKISPPKPAANFGNEFAQFMKLRKRKLAGNGDESTQSILYGAQKHEIRSNFTVGQRPNDRADDLCVSFIILIRPWNVYRFH